MSADAPDDADRYPTLGEHGAEMLRFLREHPHAPIYRNESGNRLLATDLARVRAFEREVDSEPVGWAAGREPEWLAAFVRQALEDVPFYRAYGARPGPVAELPTVTRADLGRDITRFFPDSVPLERLINFSTSGTTGHALLLASHPVVAASYLPFHKKALRRFGIELTAGRGKVGVVLFGWQRRCFTYVSVTPAMDESGLAKLNLHPDDWRHPDDRARYVDALQAELWTGDPIAFGELAKLPVRSRPKAMLSTSMALLPGCRRELEARFGCPVLDLYSLNEAGPVAVGDPRSGGHVVLQHRLWVEVVAPDGTPLLGGERGEVTLTGGFNFCLPLLRYRTGDYASLRVVNGEPVLVDLEGRPPVRFRAHDGSWLNNIEVTHALKPLALRQWALRQRRDGSLHLRVLGADSALGPLRAALLELFGAAQALVIEPVASLGDKVVQYTSELPEDRGMTPSPLELVANAVYLVSVWLANRNSVHTWWTGIVGCLLFGWFFFANRLYADVTLQAFFVVTSAWGWWQWRRGDAGRELPVRRTAPKTLLPLAALSVAIALGYGALLQWLTDAFSPFWDSAGTTASVLAQLLLVRRRVESWWFWLLADTIYVPIYVTRGAVVTAVVYAAFWVNAVFSLLRWRRLAVA